MSNREWHEDQAAGLRAMRKPNVNPGEKALMALRVIRTWAAFDIEHPELPRTLQAEHVLKLCEEAIAASQRQGGE